MIYKELPHYRTCLGCGAVIHDTDLHDKFHEGIGAAADLIEKIVTVLPKREDSRV